MYSLAHMNQTNTKQKDADNIFLLASGAPVTMPGIFYTACLGNRYMSGSLTKWAIPPDTFQCKV